jgi:hypothetical protein
MLKVDVADVRLWSQSQLIPRNILVKVIDRKTNKIWTALFKKDYETWVHSDQFKQAMETIEPQNVVCVGELRLSEEEYVRYLEVRNKRFGTHHRGGRHLFE